MSTAILILNWNGGSDTIHCLQSLLPVIGPEDYVFIIDNGSTDDSPQQIMSYLVASHHTIKITEPAKLTVDFSTRQHLYFVNNQQNLGFGGGNNTVLKQLQLLDADFSSAWLLNNDTTVTADTLKTLKLALLNHESVAVAGSLIMNQHDHSTIQCSGVNYYKWLGVSRLINKNLPYQLLAQDQTIAFDYLNGASLLFNLDALKISGYFDECFFLYSEEQDLQLRLQKQNYQLHLCVESLVYHKLSGGTSKARHLFYYHYNRSALLLSRKHFPAVCTLSAFFSLVAITFIRTFPSLKQLAWGLKGLLAGLSSRA